MIVYLLTIQVAQHKLQAAAQHGYRYFLRVGGCQNEFHVFWWFFQRFEHGIKGAFGKHVHFINDVHFVAPHRGCILGVLQDFADIINACVGCRINFQHIHIAARINLSAAIACAARFAMLHMRAIEAFGQNPRNRGFAHATGACE